MSRTAPALFSAAGLLGGYSVARSTGNRPLGGLVLAAAGAAAFRGWQSNRGTGTAVALTGIYLGAFGGSHPLARQIGAWPSVWTVTGAVAAASLALGGPRQQQGPQPVRLGRGSSAQRTAQSFQHAARQARRQK